MQQFEFMRNLTFGQYLPTGSLIHRLDSRIRLLTLFALFISITLAPHIWGLLFSICFVLLLYITARIPLQYAMKRLIPPLPFIIFMMLIQILFFRPPGDPQPIFSWKFIDIYSQDLMSAGILFLRFSSLVLALNLMTLVLSTNEMVRGVEGLFKPFQRFKLPLHDLVFVVQVTLRFLPLLAQTAERVAKAQAARGADWEGKRFQLIKNARRLFPVLVPIFLISLNRAENLALAMDARAYDSFTQRSSMVEFRLGIIDGIFFLVSISAVILIFIL